MLLLTPMCRNMLIVIELVVLKSRDRDIREMLHDSDTARDKMAFSSLCFD